MKPTRARTLLAVVVVLASALNAGATTEATPAAPTSRAPSRAPLTAPVAHFTVVRLADIPAKPWLPGHRGVDLAAEDGAVVVSPAGGTVSFAGFIVDRGVLTVRHANGLVSSFEPVDALVAAGTQVAAGQAVATVATEPDHCGSKPCVHWGVRLDGEYVDPLDYLEGFGPVVLLPVPDA